MDFDALLKRYFLGVVLALVALAAYFQAAGATQLVGSAIGAGAPAAGLAVGRPTGPSITLPSVEPKSAQLIIDSNPFDSEHRDLNPKPEEVAPVPKEPDLSDPLSVAVCDGIQVLIVTESTDPNWSVAALQGPGEPHPRMRRVGDEVAGKSVAFIGFNPKENTPAVWLEQGASVCQAMLFRTQPAVPAAPVTPVAAPPPPAPDPATPPPRGPATVPPEIASKIQKVSDNEFNIDRAAVDMILDRQGDLMRSARIVPEQKDGKVVGIRMFGIRPDTLLGTLGMQNGDRLESINGFNMASPEKALEAYARLRTASKLNVKITRRGTPQSIDYNIK